MKVLILHSYFHSLHDDKVEGGIECHTENLAKSLKNLGHDVTIACTKDSTYTKFPTILIDNVCKDKSVTPRYSHLQGYDEVLGSLEDFDLIISNNPSMTVLSHVANTSKAPVVHFLHGQIGGAGVPNSVKVLNNERVHLVAVSESIKGFYQRLGVTNEIEVLRSTWFESDLFEPTPGDYFVFFGRLVQVRNLATAVLAAKLGNFRLKIIGIGVNHPKEEQYLNFCKSMASDSLKIEWLGRLGQEEAHQVVSKSKGMLNLCHTEAFGLAAYEAQVMGVPLIYETKGKFLPGVSEFATEETSLSYDSYRMSVDKQAEVVSQLMSQVDKLNRSEIKQKFANGLSKFESTLKEILDGIN